MIKRLRMRFILISMGSFTMVVLAIIIVINVVMTKQMDTRTDGLVNTLLENKGRFPDLHDIPPYAGHEPPRDSFGGFNMNEEMKFATRYFTVEASAKGEIERMDTGHVATVSSEEAEQYALEALGSGRQQGYIGIYKYKISQQSDGIFIVFLDCRNDLETRQYVLAISAIVAAVSFLVILALVSLLSGMAIRPVAEGIEKQRRFITDAGHEIKTPLAIISANADVLELDSGASEWTQSIKNQTARLNKLVQDMLTLSKMEEGAPLELAELDLSELVRSAAEQFSVIAQSQGKSLSMELQPGICIKGNRDSIYELVNILVDNAVKYCVQGGNIRIETASKDRRARLMVKNSVDNMPEGRHDRFFDRFYRADDSRARQTGGYGIGLSIAKAVAEAHGAKIACNSSDEEICFTVDFKE